ncbi:MAG: class I SAM-dependent methyltransferase [Methylacidiphilales bacterium]|nr:class I SAM-dependent methyltransferase [Candidatus Methylacidiphilales bacterium]
MKPNQTREKQYQFLIEREKQGLSKFGLMSSQVWQDDPRRLGFVLSRYKFVSKMLSGMNHVLEIGCADAFGTRVVRQEVPFVTAVDFDPLFIASAAAAMDPRWPIITKVHDMLVGPLKEAFDGAYALDVIEHIQPRDEDRFIGNIVKSLNPNGVLILGSPSLQSQVYASPASKEGHVNCKEALQFKILMQKFFHNVFIFSMNDEVVHTGYHPMAHYLFALCCTKR